MKIYRRHYMFLLVWCIVVGTPLFALVLSGKPMRLWGTVFAFWGGGLWWNATLVRWKARTVLNASNDPTELQRIRAKRFMYGPDYIKLKTDDPVLKEIRNAWIKLEIISGMIILGGLIMIVTIWSILE